MSDVVVPKVKALRGQVECLHRTKRSAGVNVIVYRDCALRDVNLKVGALETRGRFRFVARSTKVLLTITNSFASLHINICSHSIPNIPPLACCPQVRVSFDPVLQVVAVHKKCVEFVLVEVGIAVMPRATVHFLEPTIPARNPSELVQICRILLRHVFTLAQQ